MGDTGASCHVSSTAIGLTNNGNPCRASVIVGDGRSCSVTMNSDIKLQVNENSTVELYNVRVVEKMDKNIISIGQLLKDGGTIMKGSGDTLKVKYQGVVLNFQRSMKDGLYYLEGNIVPATDEINNVTLGHDEVWKTVTKEDKGKPSMAKDNRPIMNRTEAHQKWGHMCKLNLDKTANYYGIKLQGRL